MELLTPVPAAFVPGFDHDIFVSYAHVDNQPLLVPAGTTSGGHDHRFGHSNRQILDRLMQNQPRLNKKIGDLQRQWELLSEKLSGLNEQWILETRVEEKLRLKKSIDDTKTQCDQVDLPFAHFYMIN